MEQRKSNDKRIIAGVPVMILIPLFGWATACTTNPAAPAEHHKAGELLVQFRPGTGEAGKHRAPAEPYKDGELLVKFRPGTEEAGKSQVHARHGSARIREFPELRWEHVKLPAGMSVEDAMKRYLAEPDVEYAEPNRIITVNRTANDPRFVEQWGLHNTGQTGGTPDADLDAPEAWDVTTGSSGVVVATLDTGVDYRHIDLDGNIWSNPDERANGRDDDGNGYIDDIHGIDVANHDGDPMDDHYVGHGTHVAGIIGAEGNNRIGVAGVNWDVKMIAVKIFNSQGNGTTAGAIEGLNYVKALKDRGINIVATNNSWGCAPTPIYPDCYSQALYDAINAQRSILFMAAAGNSGDDNDDPAHADYPASYYLPNVIAVAATTNKDEKAWFSDYGRRTVHVGAPGEDILSTVPSFYGFSYELMSGTSMATPHVTGLAALIKAVKPSWDWIKIRNVVLSAGDNAAAMNGTTITGKRLSAYHSLTCSNRALFSALKYPATLIPGTPVTLSALSINCDLAYGPVTVTLSGGSVVNLYDNGVSPDLAAGDGIFSASWTPSGTSESFRFSSPAGTDLVLVPKLMITSDSNLPAAKTNASYSTTLAASGGFTPYAWSIVSGSLPYGLTLNSSTGVISGTSTVGGWFDFTVQVTESTGGSTAKAMRLLVQNYEWAATYQGSYAGFNGIAVDGSGNAYVAGLIFNPTENGLIAKYDSSGNVVWSKTPGTGVRAWGIALDASGNSYVSAGQLLKLDPLGNLLWTGGGGGAAVATDSAGNAYVAGSVYDAVADAYTIRTVKYGPSGNQLMTLDYPGGTGTGIAVDGSGNIAVSGTVYVAGSGAGDNLIALKYSSTGALLWARTYDAGSGEDLAEDVAVDGGGNVCLTGQMVSHYNQAGEPAVWAMLTVKYDSAGNLVWAKQNADASNGLGIAADTAGNFFVTGWNGDFYVVKYDPSGNVLWSSFFDSGASDYSHDIALDGSGNVYVTGDAYPVGGGTDTDGFTVKFAQPKTDLTVSALAAPSSAPAGSTVQVTDTTANIGTASTWAPSTTKFYLSLDTVIDATDNMLGTRSVPELAAGASSAVTTSLVVPAGTAKGTYYIIAESDSEKMILEASEINNTLAKVIQVTL